MLHRVRTPAQLTFRTFYFSSLGENQLKNEKIDMHRRERGCLVMKLRLPVFIFCAEQRFVKVVYEKN